jgi:acetyl esterase/lipase
MMFTRREFALRCAVPLAALTASSGCGLPMERLYAVRRGLRYGPASEHTLDLWTPRFRWRNEAPGVLLVHGGSWREGTPADLEEALCRFFLRHGLVVANIDYRKVPGTPAPGAIEDVRRAARWFFANAPGFHVLTGQLVYCGTSAGGHLALMAGLAPDDAGFGAAPRPCAVFNLWGVSDLAALAANPPATPLVRDFVPAPDAALAMRRYSPLTYVRPGLPPVMSLHAKDDELVPFDQSARLDRALRQSGNESKLVALSHGGHRNMDWNEVHSCLGDFLDDALHMVD